MNIDRSKKLICSLALMFVFAVSMITLSASSAFAQDQQQSSQDQQQTGTDQEQAGSDIQQSSSGSACCCPNGGTASRVVYAQPTTYSNGSCCNGGFYSTGNCSYGNVNGRYYGRKFRSVPW
jgi:hypothetical protein